MDSKLAISTGVDVSTCRKCHTEVITALNLDEATSRLKWNVSESGVKQVARRHTISQRLLNHTQLSFIGETTSKQLAVVSQDHGVVGSTSE